jgi:hypothetical protein|eukprot:COSAG06_NODE_708_length_12893_cov_10.008676_1_plen_41_part_00
MRVLTYREKRSVDTVSLLPVYAKMLADVIGRRDNSCLLVK